MLRSGQPIKRLEGKNDNLSYLLIARTMKPDLSALIASLAEIIARLKFVHHELQRLEKQKRKA
jgi:hypothetical protein